MLFKLTIVFLILIFLLYLKNFFKLNRKEKFSEAKKVTTFNKQNLNNWMNLSKKERYNLSKQESSTYLYRRKLLLEEIRKEYKNISRGNSEKNIKGK